jgi:hypothetical protein
MAHVFTQLAQAANASISTTASFASAYKAASLPNDLYAGMDYDSLSTPEQLWVRWYTWIGDPVLATGIMSFLLHEARHGSDIVSSGSNQLARSSSTLDDACRGSSSATSPTSTNGRSRR